MDSVAAHTYVLIVAGGGGTRLWPQSREENPKQFAKLFGGQSLFEITLARALKISPPSRIFIATSGRYLQLVKSLATKIPSENIIGEPIRRDTALAHAIGALYIHSRDPQAVVVNLASDHLISPLSVFVSEIKLAARLAAENNFLVTVGIRPSFPHTGMGHIKARRLWPGEDKALVGEKFVEKPALPLAQKYTRSGHYFWNANLYVYRAQVYLDLLKTHSPKTVSLFPKLRKSLGTSDENSVLQLVFQMAPTVSIDYAVSEKLSKFICVPGSFHWTDVGDWNEVWKNLPKDTLGNVISGPHGRGRYVGIDSQNNLLFLDKQLVATVGVKDMLIVDTPDALLICPKNEAQGVKKVVAALKDNNLTQLL